jgi:glycosyltransferase involved in cell wall biosynthesis
MNISVVIPCYNAEAFVARAVNSVIADSEVIVIDDGSSDRSIDVVKALGSRIRCKVGPNQGACAARNRGLELAQKPFVMFLDADDYLKPGTLAGLARMLEDTAADFAIAPVVDDDAHGRSMPRVLPRIDSPGVFICDWLSGRFVPPCAILWRADFVRKIGGWDESLRKNQDGELVLRAMLNGALPVQSMIGGGVYWQHTSQDRISNTYSREKVMDSFLVIAKTYAGWAALDELDFKTEEAFSAATYELQRLAAREGLHEVEREIRTYRKMKNWPSHVGNTLHVLASNVLGLRAKEWLAARMRGDY